ncbi:MAG: acetyl-CoA hydrolase/transferase C-terminal domain-containing protein [Oscillospiraceae bacterium]
MTGQVCAEAIDVPADVPASAVSSILSAPRRVLSADGGFLCLHSTHEAPDGTLTSSIRARIFRPVQSSRRRAAYVMYIVTEWGAADLHNQPLETRICAAVPHQRIRARCARSHRKAVAWGRLSPECAAQFDTQPEPEGGNHMNLAYEPLFTPFSIRNTRIKNRYFMAAVGTVTHNDGEDGACLPGAVDYFVRRAAGGVGT